MSTTIAVAILAEAKERIVATEKFDCESVKEFGELLSREKPPTTNAVEQFIKDRFGKSSRDKA